MRHIIFDRCNQDTFAHSHISLATILKRADDPIMSVAFLNTDTSSYTVTAKSFDYIYTVTVPCYLDAYMLLRILLSGGYYLESDESGLEPDNARRRTYVRGV
jgi:hypothetical protein